MKEDVTIRVIKYISTSLNMSAMVPGCGMAAGTAAFLITPDGDLYCDLIHVEPHQRRQGVASALFDHAEHHFRKKAVCSLELTPDSVSFFQSRGTEIDCRAIVLSYDEWTGIGEATDEDV